MPQEFSFHFLPFSAGERPEFRTSGWTFFARQPDPPHLQDAPRPREMLDEPSHGALNRSAGRALNGIGGATPEACPCVLRLTCRPEAGITQTGYEPDG